LEELVVYLKICGFQTIQIQLAKTLNHITFLMRCKSQGIIPRGFSIKTPSIVDGLPILFNGPVGPWLGTEYIFIGIIRYPNSKTTIFNKTFVETVNKLILDKNVMHPQTSNNIISLKDLLVLLEITETDLIKVIQGVKNKKSA
jgi:hypothetical protein